jgi:tetratricopeptide (TPR) repeat protein
MRLAVLVAPSLEPLAWLDGALRRLGFHVTALEGDGPFPGRVGRALSSVTKADTVLLHISGSAVADGAVRLGEGEAVSLDALSAAVAATEADSVLMFAELTHDGVDDAVVAVEHVADARAALGSTAYGHSALIEVKAASRDPLAFTRLVMRVAADAEEEDGATLSTIVQTLRSMPETSASAQSYAFVRGTVDFQFVPAGSDLPVVEPLIALADGARARDEWDQALAGYRAALLLLPSGSTSTPSIPTSLRAQVHARIGEVLRARGDLRKARRAFERAYETCPRERLSLDALIAMSFEEQAWTRVVELSRARLDILETTAEKVDELFGIARTLAGKLGDMAGAVGELEKARAMDPANDDVLEALRRSYRVLARWPDLLEVTGALASLAPTAAERAARRVAQARIQRDQLGDGAGAIELIEAALEEDATHDEALDALVELRTSRGEFIELERVLASLVARLAELGDADRAEDAQRRLDATRAARPPDSAARLSGIGGEEGVLIELESLVVEKPLHSPTHARLFAAHVRAEQTDRAYLEALVLEELGALAPEQRSLLEQWRPDGLRVRTPLASTAWELLRAPGCDPVVESLFCAVGRAAVAVCAEDRKPRRKLLALDPARRQEETSTATVVRSFHWAARVLGVDCPELYVLDDVPGDVAAVPARVPSTALGPGVLRGLSTKDLAFVAGRHLTYYRPDTAVLPYFSTLPELTVLVLACVQLVMPAMPMPAAVAPAVAELRGGLARRLGEEERAALTLAVHKLDARGGRVDLAAWIRSVELTAGRAGLLLCGDLRTAMTRIRSETRAVADLTVDEKRVDLIGFCCSRTLAELRASVAVVASTPPPRSSGVMHRVTRVGSGEWSEAL